MKKIVGIFAFSLLLHASVPTTNALTLDEALQLLKTKNLEIKAAKFDELSAKEDIDVISGKNWGNLTFTQDMARSNDAGNVFGFKLTSREATFGDFGFADFLSPPPGTTNVLTVQPTDLNYPGYRNLFQTKLKYEVPLFTGFMISSYTDIMKRMKEMKSLDKNKIEKQKKYELKKSFYDMALLDSSIKNLNKILDNIHILENTTKEMIAVGYAKKVDLLEVKAKEGNVERLLVQMNSNKKLLYHFISFLLNKKVDHIQTPVLEVAMPKMSDEDILQHNVDIKKATTGLKITKDMLKASQSAYYPMIGAFGEVGTADDTFLGDADKHKAYTIGARLSWNFFDGGIDASKIEKSRIEKLKMQSQVELAKKGILLKIAKIRTQIESADVEIASLKKELDLANAIYENYEGRYKEKLVSMSDVIIKQSAQIEKILQLQIAKNKRTEKILALENLANGEN